MPENIQKKSKLKSGSGTGTGQSVIDLCESKVIDSEKKSPVKEIPIGLPVSQEEYEKLEAQAKRNLSKKADKSSKEAASDSD